MSYLPHEPPPSRADEQTRDEKSGWHGDAVGEHRHDPIEAEGKDQRNWGHGGLVVKQGLDRVGPAVHGEGGHGVVLATLTQKRLVVWCHVVWVVYCGVGGVGGVLWGLSGQLWFMSD